MATLPPPIAARIRTVLAIDPRADAVGFEGHWLRWGDLADQVGALDRSLEVAGARGAGAPVGLILRNRPEMVGALLGVLASERCAVVLNPHQGDARLAAELREQRLRSVVACEQDWQRAALRDAARSAGSAALVAGAMQPLEGFGEPGPGPHAAPLPGVALQMPTSGTTGAPKRVPIPARALAHALGSAKHYERDRSAAPRLRSGKAIVNAPLVHVGGLFRVLQCICDGRAFVLLDRFALGPWLEAVRRYRPRTVSLVPAALRAVLDADIDPADLSSLVAVVSGTAPLPPEDAEAFEQRHGIPVLTSYGATEFAGGVAGWSLDDHRRLRASKRGSVGRAHPGCELRVVEPESGRVLEPGAEGLLEVRAPQLGHDGWVRTTDRARMDGDGFLWITGRADAAILRGGFKVQPDEVRTALEAHPAVREAAVVGLDDARLGQVPVAAVECTAGLPAPDAGTLRAFARERLAAYQVPERIAVVDALPRTPSLKVSLPAVRALFTGAADARDGDGAGGDAADAAGGGRPR